ncbi:MAG: FtsK/SpoIIIE domain-containing protein [Kiritimatiellia bacterium]|nr:FtsK/SpoIIIE domain-containing protein [Kiritimatiellia bacterium]MDP6847835.1 FtsK/SpoIIIE domain-containing protein [Kiritimatiellia bacterium]
MSSNLGIRETLELLDGLRSAVTSFTEKEKNLSRALGARSAAERRDMAEAIKEIELELSKVLAEAEAERDSAISRSQSRYAARKPRIGIAHRSSKQKLLERIDSDEGHRKYELQKQMMDAERAYPESWERTDTEFEDFRRELAEIDRSLGKLEKNCKRAFRGYPSLLRISGDGQGGAQPAEPEPVDQHALRDALQKHIRQTADKLADFKRQPLPSVFRILPPWLVTMLIIAAGAVVGFAMHNREIAHASYSGAAIAAALLAGAVGLNIRGRPAAQEAAPGILSGLVEARRLYKACDESSTRNHEKQLKLIDARCENKFDALENQWGSVSDSAETMRLSCIEKLDVKAARAAEKNEQLFRLTQERIEREHSDTVARIKQEAEAARKELTDACENGIAGFRSANEGTWKELAEEWRNRIHPIYDEVTRADAAARKSFPNWDDESFSDWKAPATFARAAKFAHLDVDLKQLCGDLPGDDRLALPGTDRFSMPLCLTFPDQGSVLFETWNFGRDQAIATLNTIVLRLLATTSPSKLGFTILDPVELGQNFAGVMHLADYEEALVNSRIWTQPSHIEQRLADLNEHMEKVIQMYLRNEYENIAQYNEQAGEIAEKYHFLVVADFPVNFTDIAARRLLSIAASGARCGVYTLIHWDHRRSVPQDLVPDELRKGSVCFSGRQNRFVLADRILKGVTLELDSQPAPDFATKFLHRVGESSVDSSHVEVPFSHVVPGDSELWSIDTSEELRIPIGRTGATKLLQLALGKGTRQHALIAGKTGSGKSTLLHVLITNLSLWCSPEQVEFYLVDFKKGVEFKCYASKHLPHARVIAIESDREFGMSVLQRVDDELKRRGDMFRELGVQDIPGYKRAGGTEPVPRTLLIVDEFQEFFVEDDRISQNAALLLDRIVRQGRAFGIHVLLGSQTLGGAYTLARTTLGQMVIRIALQCSEADSYLIMDDNNPAPRLLSRPGEAIYNDSAGMIEGNSPFQVVWLPDEVRDSFLDKVVTLADERPGEYRGPIIFEGNAPADVRDNELLAESIGTRPGERPGAARVWLGAPNSIKGPTEATFLRQSGHNLLVVGQRDEAALATMVVSMVALAAQHPAGTARFILFDGTAPGSAHRELIGKVIENMRHEVTVVSNSDTASVMKSVVADMTARENDPANAVASTFIMILGLQKFKKLRFEEDFSFSMDDSDSADNPGRNLNEIICEGGSNGIHVIATCDTCNNITRFLSRKALSEFEMRVLFQMSANDSAMLIDSPRASGLGLHRAIFYNEHEGYTEVFRPYALPGGDWIEEVGARL